MSATIEVRWHPLGEPVPRGWKLAQRMDQTLHHNRYSVLIQRMAHRWKQKTNRRTGLRCARLLAAMPVGWQSTRDVAQAIGYTRNAAGVTLLRAWRAGLVERRDGACPCCHEQRIEWRRRK